MNIDRVTITGADDSVNPKELVNLSQKYPFVEWGILLSRSQEGGSRYPSRSWMQDLSRLMNDDHGLDEQVHTAGHLCGAWLRDLLKGTWSCPHLDLGIFERVQLNFHKATESIDKHSFLSSLKDLRNSGRSIIFQWDVIDPAIFNYVKQAIPLQVLFDYSHGTGKLPNGWLAPLRDTFCGYAGGLGPDNLKSQLYEIEKVSGDRKVWIDMETKVRSKNNSIFDLDKVNECLEIAAPFTGVRHAQFNG